MDRDLEGYDPSQPLQPLFRDPWQSKFPSVCDPGAINGSESSTLAAVSSSGQQVTNPPVSVCASRLQSKARRFAHVWVLAFATLGLSAFTIFYAYQVLVSKKDVPPALVLSPGKTVLVVNILSHMVAMLGWDLLIAVFEALRWALACRMDGVLVTTFLALSRATAPLGVAYLFLTKGAHRVWCIQRLMWLALTSVLGIVLIADITFKNVYTSNTSEKVAVVAGLAPLNPLILTIAPPSLVNIHVIGYMTGILTDPKFVTSIPPLACTGSDCTSIFLPGGLNLVRRDKGFLSGTLFDGQQSLDYTSILVYDAPGFQVEFSPIDHSYRFNSTDCKMYGQSIGEGIYICLSSHGAELLVGWTVCPLDLFNARDCFNNQTWTKEMDQSTAVSLFKRRATVAYDSKSLSILSIESISSPVAVPIDPSAFRQYCSIVMAPIPAILNTSDRAFAGPATSYSAQYGIGWVLRLYKADFPTFTVGPLDMLRGFLTVAFQFSTTMWQSLDFKSLPEDMKTTASLSQSTYRARAQPWTVFTFGVVAVVLCFWGMGCLAWVCIWGPYSPNASLFPEIDITSKCTHPTSLQGLPNGQKAERPEGRLGELGNLMRECGLGNGMSDAVVRGIKGKRVICGASQSSDGRERSIVLVTEKGKIGSLSKQEKYA